MRTSIHPPAGTRLGIGDWLERARCHIEDMPTDFFFPPEGGAEEARMAKRFCEECETRMECLTVGMYESFGIWGGLSIAERVELRDVARGRGLSVRQALRIPRLERKAIVAETVDVANRRNTRLWMMLK